MPVNYRNKANFTAGVGIDEIFTAAIDLSAKQFYFVAAGSIVGEVTTSTGASNPVPVGVLQNAPGAAGQARVRVFGTTQLTACAGTCDVNYGRFVRSSSVGAAEAPASAGGAFVLGRWLSASVATNGSSLGNAFVSCMGLAACAPSAS